MNFNAGLPSLKRFCLLHLTPRLYDIGVFLHPWKKPCTKYRSDKTLSILTLTSATALSVVPNYIMLSI